MFPLVWRKNESLDTKLARLSSLIHTLRKKGNDVTLVGVSAGASAVLNVYAEDSQLTKVICICGKVNRPAAVSSFLYKRNPAFRESMSRVDRSVAGLTNEQRQNILSIHPWVDLTVPVSDTRIAGAVEKTVPGWSHAIGIISGIVIGAPTIAKFIRKRPLFGKLPNDESLETVN